jgi:hypothetical protein
VVWKTLVKTAFLPSAAAVGFGDEINATFKKVKN